MQEKPESPARGCLTIIAVVSGAFVVTVGIMAFFAWQLSMTATNDLRQRADAIAEGFQKAFQFTPEIRVQSTVLVAQDSAVLELVTAERRAVIQNNWEHSWLGSRKVFEIEATFVAKAGFDLREPFTVKLEDRNGSTKLDLPNPKILSLGMTEVKIKRDEDGLWNKLTEEDRQLAFRELEKVARVDFERSSLRAQATAEIEKRVREIMRTLPSPTPAP